MEIPKSWDKVTVEGYINLMKSLEKESEDVILESIKRIVFLTGCEPEEASQCTLDQIQDIKRLVNTPLPTRLKTRFKLKGINYRLLYLTSERLSKWTNEDLETLNKLDARQMTGGEYCAAMDVIARGQLDNLHHVMFLISQPIKFGFKKKFPFFGWKDYDFLAYEIKDRINDFKSLTMEVAYPASVFFCEASKKLTTSLQEYSENEMMTIVEQMDQLESELAEEQGGSTSLMDSLVETKPNGDSSKK